MLAVVTASTHAARAPRLETVALSIRPDGVWRVRLGDGRATRVPGTEGAVDASWAPSGRELAFERGGRVFLINRDGTGIRALARGGAPAWSSDGRRVAFSREGRIVVARRNGRGAHAVTEGPADTRPTWSPDGGRIAFSRGGVVSLVPAVGGAVAALTEGDDPDWSPDGGRIAFVRADGIATVAADGSDLRVVVAEPGAASPAWLPGASEVAVGAADVRRVPVGAERLPDLDQRAPSRVGVSLVAGRYRLGFASAVDNVGRGPLWIRGTRTRVGMHARQRVRVGGGPVESHLDAGTLRYTWSPTHTHWHLLRFMTYELRRARDHVLVGRDRKSGFCLADHYGQAPGIRAGPPAFLDDCRAGRPRPRTVEQGTSVGYTDRYPPSFHGQDIALTGVPPGIYVLVHRANPDRLLRERSYANNAASVRLRLTRPGGVPRVAVLRRCPGSERC